MEQSLTPLAVPDYPAQDVLVVDEPAQLRALGDDLRAKLVRLLRDRAASTTELAEQLGLPKGTIGHHLKVLERAGLVRVVRTRKVRAMTEKQYGRVARLFVLKSTDAPLQASVAAAGLRQAADEIRAMSDDDETSTFSTLHARLSDADARRLSRRLQRIGEEFRARDTPGGRRVGFVFSLYPLDGPDA